MITGGKTMTVKIDRDECIGCGMCADICPAVYAMDDESIATVVAQPDAASEECAQEAADSCPVSAITIE